MLARDESNLRLFITRARPPHRGPTGSAPFYTHNINLCPASGQLFESLSTKVPGLPFPPPLLRAASPSPVSPPPPPRSLLVSPCPCPRRWRQPSPHVRKQRSAATRRRREAEQRRAEGEREKRKKTNAQAERQNDALTRCSACALVAVAPAGSRHACSFALPPLLRFSRRQPMPLRARRWRRG